MNTSRTRRRFLRGSAATLAGVLLSPVPDRVDAKTPTPADATPSPTSATPVGAYLMKIRLVFENTTLTASMIDSEASRGFVALLPLTLTLDDYNGTEKINYLASSLPTSDAPSGFDPSPGDITYYAPWGNLAIFYRDFGYSTGLVHLGTIEGALGPLDVPGSLDVTIELDN